MPRREVVVFRGIKFRRYPDAKDWSTRRYFRPGICDGLRGVESLHREVWKAAHGPIPPGHEVHHADGDQNNNELSNLVCVQADAHIETHRRLPVSAERAAARIKHINHARTFASLWHRSEAGRQWHAEHGRRTMLARAPVSRECEHCGTRFETIQPWAKYCSGACKTRARDLSGVDNEQRICPQCGMSFEINQYRKARHCSRRCARYAYMAAHSRP